MSKGSYHAKHRERIKGTAEEHEVKRMPHVSVSDEQRSGFEEGRLVLIDKPLHWTSFDVVRKIRNSIRIKKVGHAGTLDPLATGLLIICTGKFTKQINSYMAEEKEYTGSFTLGAVTPTYDKESKPEDFKPFDHVTEQMIIDATKKFIGDIKQFPPVYAAIKKEGVALYELARRGTDVELEARPVTIKEFEITRISMPVIEFRVVCSTGTYIRSLAHDMGATLGTGAYLSSLRRTRIGGIRVEDSMTMEGFLEDLRLKNEE